MCKYLVALDTFVSLNGQKFVDKLTQENYSRNLTEKKKKRKACLFEVTSYGPWSTHVIQKLYYADKEQAE